MKNKRPEANQVGWEMFTKTKLPDGWKTEVPPFSTHCLVIEADNGGCVTVDFERRLFRAGYAFSGRAESHQQYAGRGWKSALCADAASWLQSATT